MWCWLKHGRECSPQSSFSLFPRSPRLREVRFGYEKADVSVTGEPIPWNADTVFVEALVELARPTAVTQSEFDLDVPGEIPITAVEVRPGSAAGVMHVLFRFAPPQRTRLAHLQWRGRTLGHLALPYLGPEDFLQNLRLETPTLFVQLGGRNVACAALVEGTEGTLTACGLLRSTTSLLPLLDWPLTVDIVDARTGHSDGVALPLLGVEVMGRHALLNVSLPMRPATVGSWSVRWAVAGRLLAQCPLRVISRQAFRDSLYVPAGMRFNDASRVRNTTREPPLHFRVASREPGIAALCPLEVRLCAADRGCLMQGRLPDVVVTESPSPWLPGPVAIHELPRVESLELFSEGRFLGCLAWEPAPVARLTSEGGFACTPSFPWTAGSETELEERLTRLMAQPTI